MLQRLSTLFGIMSTHDFPKLESIFKVSYVGETHAILLLIPVLAKIASN